MTDPLPPVRRVVTATDINGRSRIVEDAPATAIHTVAERPGFRAMNLWRTEESPARISAADSTPLHSGVLPPRGGTVLRVVDFPPEPHDSRELARSFDATFDVVLKDARRDHREKRHPGMHLTETLDYAIVLEGEVWSVMDQGETLLRAGDVLIQRGTNHSWANRSSRTARIAFVLIDGTP
jgi:hypothetical protein